MEERKTIKKLTDYIEFIIRFCNNEEETGSN